VASRDRQQPVQERPPVLEPKEREAERLAQDAQMLAARLGPRGVGLEGANPGDPDLLPDEGQHLLRDHLPWSSQATGVTQHAQLEGKAEAVGIAAAGGDRLKALPAQGAVPHELRFACRPSKERIGLSRRQDLASRHGELSQLKQSSSATIPG
jgi:hypothetical protein